MLELHSKTQELLTMWHVSAFDSKLTLTGSESSGSIVTAVADLSGQSRITLFEWQLGLNSLIPSFSFDHQNGRNQAE